MESSYTYQCESDSESQDSENSFCYSEPTFEAEPLFYKGGEFIGDRKWDFYQSMLDQVCKSKKEGSRKQMAYHLYMDKLVIKYFEHLIDNQEKFRSANFFLDGLTRNVTIAHDKSLERQYILSETSLYLQLGLNEIKYEMNSMKRTLDSVNLGDTDMSYTDAVTMVVSKSVKVVNSYSRFLQRLGENFDRLSKDETSLPVFVIAPAFDLTLGAHTLSYCFVAYFLDTALMIFDIYKKECQGTRQNIFSACRQQSIVNLDMLKESLQEVMHRYPFILTEIGCTLEFSASEKPNEKTLEVLYNKRLDCRGTFKENFCYFVDASNGD